MKKKYFYSISVFIFIFAWSISIHTVKLLFANAIIDKKPISFAQFVKEFKDSPELNQETLYLMVRHAYAPGYGDPANFEIGNCHTQRNLNQEGREQAKALGQLYQDAKVFHNVVYSSQWCRCLETAQNLYLHEDMEVKEHPGLNSFFQGIVDRQKTLQHLNAFFRDNKSPAMITFNDRNNRIQFIPITIMVTHQVVISAITGIGVSSGGMVIYNPRTKTTQEIIGTQ